MTPFVSVELSLMDILAIPSKPRASLSKLFFCLFLSCFFFLIYLITKGNTKENKNSKKQKTNITTYRVTKETHVTIVALITMMLYLHFSCLH